MNANGFDFNAAADAAERAATSPEGEAERAAVYALLHHLEEIQLATMNQRLARCSGPPPGHERLPLRDEGEDYGRIEARIPRDLFWGLYHQKNFGPEGLLDASGLKDLLKAFPQCRVQTVSGKTTVGYSAPVQRFNGSTLQRRKSVQTRGRVHFGHGTMTFAT